MNILWLLFLAVSADSSLFRSAQPAPDAAAAYARLETGDADRACAEFVQQLRDASADPWAYRGAATCATGTDRDRKRVLEALKELAQGSPLVLFAHGLIHHDDGKNSEAERLLRECIAKAPDLVLAWNQLAVVVQESGNIAAAMPLLQKALELAPDLEMAQQNLEQVQLHTYAQDRLAGLIMRLPSFWGQLPAPRVPISGKTIEEVLTESKEAQRIAEEQILDLALTPLAAREELMARRVPAGLQEVDIWAGFAAAQGQLTADLGFAALICEASLQLAAYVGRKDALVFGAALCTNAIVPRINNDRLLSGLQAWYDLPRFEGAGPYMAQFSLIYADALSRGGQKSAALSVYQEAHRTFALANETLGQGNALKGMASALFHLNEVEKSLSTYASACSLLQTAEDDIGLANCLSGKGDVLLWLNMADEALAAHKEAGRLFQSTGDSIGRGNAFVGEAEVLFARGDLEGSLSAYLAARSSFRAVNDLLGEGNALAGEAEVRFHLGKIEAALAAYRAAGQFYREIGSAIGVANTILGKASILHHLRDFEGALSTYYSAYEMHRGVDSSVGAGNALLGMAELLAQQGRNNDALSLHQEARELFEATRSLKSVANSIKGEADVYLSLDQVDEALKRYNDARPLFRKSNDLLGLGNTYLMESVALSRLSEKTLARQAVTEAKNFYLEANENYNRTKAILWEILLQDRDQEVESIKELARQAIRLHRGWRKGYVTEQHRTDWDQNITLAYDYLIPILAREGNVSEALTRAEESRSRALLDLLAADHLGELKMSPEILEKDRAIKARLARLDLQLGQAKNIKDREEFRLTRNALDRELERNLHNLIASRSSEAILGEPLRFQQIQEVSEDVGPILLFYAADIHAVAFLVLPSSGIYLYTIDVGWPDLNTIFDEYLYNLTNRELDEIVLEQANELWKIFVEPAEKLLPPSGPITIVPHGPLHGLPFEALFDSRSGKFLFERWDVAISPSVSALFSARRRHAGPQSDDSLVVFAAGVGLDVSEKDTFEIQRQFPAPGGRQRGPEAATFDFYQKVASKARHLLIATRGVHVQGERRGTFLEINPTPDVHDKRLTAAEIAAIPLNAELITLSACDTDYGEALFSDDRLTLSRSFLIAGAASVLATRWYLPDERSTNRFLLDFYQAFRKGSGGQGMRKDRALTLARRKAVERGEPARSWAAWVLLGDARK